MDEMKTFNVDFAQQNNQILNKPTWGDLRITIPVLLASGLTIGYAFAGFLTGA